MTLIQLTTNLLCLHLKERIVKKSSGQTTTSLQACLTLLEGKTSQVTFDIFNIFSLLRLYKNYNGLLDKFAQFWGLVAQTFADRDSVIGYEIMNEPWCGDIYEVDL